MTGAAQQCAMVATEEAGGVPLCPSHLKMLHRGPRPTDAGTRALYAAAGLDPSRFPALSPPEGRRTVVYSRKSVRTHGSAPAFYVAAEWSTEP